MRHALILLGLCAVLLAMADSEKDPFDPLKAVEEFDALVQKRLADPLAPEFGMQRIVDVRGLGRHLVSELEHGGLRTRMTHSFHPKDEVERNVVSKLVAHNVEMGLYLVGAAVLGRMTERHDARALRGPGMVTPGKGLPRGTLPPDPDALPGLQAIYPLAHRAMRTFRDGGKGFEAKHGTWNIAARPTLASDQRCVDCHNATGQTGRTFKRGDALGGVLYAYRTR
ncbi:MAG: hypothetical protein JNL98_37465 [Bryobacterales bacterium]|nr:hypothetical protein [Bryobacterales bacterium]